ncbi:hypothetical protein MferCBS31731_000986 [Microsporum ferrugineum]
MFYSKPSRPTMITTALFVFFILPFVHSTPVAGTELALRGISQAQPGANDSKFVSCMKEKYPGYPNEIVKDHIDLIYCGDIAEAIDGDNNGLSTRDISIYQVTSYLKDQFNRLGIRDDSQSQAENPADSIFVTCIQEKYPLFPHDKPAYEDIQRCHAARLNQLHSRGDDDENRRDPVVDIFGIPVTFANVCTDRDLPKNFLKAADFRADARQICDDMVSDLLKNATGVFGQNLNIAWTKKASSLYKHKDVILWATLSLSPQARSALAGVKAAKEAYDTICMNAISIFGTKGEGCTSELGSIQGTTTGVKDGFLDLLIGGVKQGLLTIDFRQKGEE